MSIWSARYHNPNAWIVLLTDDNTERLLTGIRGSLLEYVSEKVVVPFDDENASAMYRSRWIKTSVRRLVRGDFLFIDCDTIVCKSLGDVDAFDCEVGAVWESHLLVSGFCSDLKKSTSEANRRLGVDLDAEKEYYSSGILYVKDTQPVSRFYSLWHEFWKESYHLGLPIDQPAMAKANRDSGHIIQKIPDTYNCIVFTQNTFIEQAHILHISSYRNPSFLFTEIVLGLLQRDGLTDWLKDVILHPCDSMLPFDYAIKHSTRKERRAWIERMAETADGINNNLPILWNAFPMTSSLKNVVTGLFRHRYHHLGAMVWLLWRRWRVASNVNLKNNVCRN